MEEPHERRVLGKKKSVPEGDAVDEKDWQQILNAFSCVSFPIPTQPPIPPQTTWHAKKLAKLKELHNKESSQPCMKGSMTLAWFKNINLDEIDELYFPESLLIVTESGANVGKYIFSVRKCIFGEEPGVVVYMESRSKLQDGSECGSTILGLMNNFLHPIQEYTYEWVRNGKRKIQRRCTLIRETDLYYYKTRTESTDACPTEASFTYPLSDFDTVITEAGNALLQKIMVIEHRTGSLALKTLKHSGQIVKNTYTTLGITLETFRAEEMEVVGNRRTVTADGVVEEWDAIFSKTGRLLLKCQLDKDHALIPLWFRPIQVTNGDATNFSPQESSVSTYPPLLWNCDPELYALFLERKDLIASERKAYLLRNPKLRALLADFVQAVLLHKPENSADFAGEFFQPFLNKHEEINLCISDLDIIESESMCLP